MPCERKHVEAIRAWMDGLIHAAQVEIEKHPGDNASAAAALFYWADGPEQRAAREALAACDESPCVWRFIGKGDDSGFAPGCNSADLEDPSRWTAEWGVICRNLMAYCPHCGRKIVEAPLPAAPEGKP